MPKFLMFDHGGVLDGCIVDKANVSNNDLVLKEYEWGDVQVLKNGVQIVNAIEVLTKYHGYEVVFHSKNAEEDQLNFLSELQQACKKKGLEFPKVRAMAVYDPALYSNISSSNPNITVQQSISVASWGADDLDGKASVRRVLEKLLGIEASDRGNHIVFDDGKPNVSTPKEEGYQAFLIGVGEADRVSLDVALQQILSKNEEVDINDSAIVSKDIPKLERDKLNYIHKTLGLSGIEKIGSSSACYLKVSSAEFRKRSPCRDPLGEVKALCAQYIGHAWAMRQDSSEPYSPDALKKKEEVFCAIYHAKSKQEARKILADNSKLLNTNRTPWSILILKTMVVILTLPISLIPLLNIGIKRGTVNFFKPDSELLSEKLTLELSKAVIDNKTGLSVN